MTTLKQLKMNNPNIVISVQFKNDNATVNHYTSMISPLYSISEAKEEMKGAYSDLIVKFEEHIAWCSLFENQIRHLKSFNIDTLTGQVLLIKKGNLSFSRQVTGVTHKSYIEKNIIIVKYFLK